VGLREREREREHEMGLGFKLRHRQEEVQAVSVAVDFLLLDCLLGLSVFSRLSVVSNLFWNLQLAKTLQMTRKFARAIGTMPILLQLWQSLLIVTIVVHYNWCLTRSANLLHKILRGFFGVFSKSDGTICMYFA
jgi:hypothetical protein